MLHMRTTNQSCLTVPQFLHVKHMGLNLEFADCPTQHFPPLAASMHRYTLLQPARLDLHDLCQTISLLELASVLSHAEKSFAEGLQIEQLV